MDKLIVTIIAISLGAVTLLWGADYMSNFYQAAQSKAKAQAWVAGAAQITMAARQAGNLSTGGDNWTPGSGAATAALLVPDYMSGLPQYNGAYAFQPCKLTSGSASCPEYSTNATMIFSQVENILVCEYIEMLANRNQITWLPPVFIQPAYAGSPSTLPSSTSVGSNPIIVSSGIPVNPNQQFTCLAVSGSVTGYYFFYRVFMDR